MGKELKNKPLIEAIFELKWDLQDLPNGGKGDPNYRILVGMLYEKLNQDYPFIEPLETASMPDEMVAHIVQNRFRVDEQKWPLMQIGPGIITINDTENYKWEDFEERILKVVSTFIDIYPNPQNLNINSISLRYINAIGDFNNSDNMIQFLKEKMHTNVEFHEKLFENTGVRAEPLGFDFKTTFKSINPEGAVMLRFAKGEFEDVSKLVMETMVISIGEDIPNKDEIQEWIKKAHTLTDDWFFKIIEGELEKRFEEV